MKKQRRPSKAQVYAKKMSPKVHSLDASGTYYTKKRKGKA
jgi:hypothetical protein